MFLYSLGHIYKVEVPCVNGNLQVYVHYIKQASWKEANKKQQEKLLELIRRLAEDDKEGVIAHKVCICID